MLGTALAGGYNTLTATRGANGVAMYHMTEEEFEAVVEAALEAIPDQFLDALENVVFTVADEPEAEQLDAIDTEWAEVCDDELLGLYEGTPLTDRGIYYGESGGLPDVITIFKGPHERCFQTREAIVEEIRKTVIHEVGHYFGNDEAMLAAMGY